MTYRVVRNGETHGTYSLMQLQRHLASGEVLESDLAQLEGTEEWLQVAEVIPAPAPYHATQEEFRSPPDLRWWIVFVLGVLTLNIFSIAWDIYETIWLRSVERRSVAFWFYVVSAVLFLLKIQGTWHSILYNVGLGPAPDDSYSLLFTAATIVLAVISRLVLRQELLNHFNGREHLGLRLNWLLSILLGGLYFQYHFNLINEKKRALRVA